jgi:hypothetical protein
MKKGTKLTDVDYFLEVRDLSHNPVHLSTGTSLRELVRLAAEHVPSMDNYSKVYREMRVQLGVYIGLFVLVSAGQLPMHVVVIIRSSSVSPADLERFHAHAQSLPKDKLPEDF